MSTIGLKVEGIGFWASGLPDWDAARAFLGDGSLPAQAPRRPAPELLAPNERRRAPDTVLLAIEVAQAACRAAGADPATLPSVFASTHGDLAITDGMCAAIAQAPRTISPTRFHNSVHNAAAGYWTIGGGCMAPTTALSAYRASFAQGLLEAAAQLVGGAPRVLLVGYDGESAGPLRPISPSEGLLAGALVLSACGDGADLGLSLDNAVAAEPAGALATRYAGNAMAPMLPLFELLAGGGPGTCELHAGPKQCVRLECRR